MKRIDSRRPPKCLWLGVSCSCVFLVLILLSLVMSEVAFAATRTAVVENSDAGWNFFLALSIMKSVPSYDKVSDNLIEMLREGRIFLSDEIMDPFVDWGTTGLGNPRISLPAHLLTSGRKWNLNDPTDYGWCLRLAHILVHENRHTEQSRYAISWSGVWDIVGGNPTERQAYIEELLWLDRFIQGIFSDLITNYANIPRDQLIQKLQRLGDALGMKSADIEHYNRDGYGEIPWSRGIGEYFWILTGDIRNEVLRMQSDPNYKTPKARIESIEGAYSGSEGGIEGLLPSEQTKLTEEINQGAKEVKLVDEKPVQQGLYDSQVIGETRTNHANVTIPPRFTTDMGMLSIFELKYPPSFLLRYDNRHGRSVGGLIMIEPSGQTFDQEITVTLWYDPSVDPKRIDIFWWNAKTQNLEKITAERTIDRKNHTISVKVTHFTTFAVLLVPVPTGYNTAWLTFTASSVAASCLYLFFRRRKRLIGDEV